MSLSVTLVKAAGVMTFTANPASNDTVLIGGITYKYEATPAAANDIDVGSDLEASLANLVLAVNNEGAAPSGEYFAGTVPALGMIGSSTATVFTLTARFGGEWANRYGFVEGVDAGAGYSVTTAMAGGVGDISGASGIIASLVNDNQLNAEVIRDLNLSLLLETAL